MTSIGKNCYTDRIVLDDDIVLKSLPSGKYLVSGLTENSLKLFCSIKL